MATFDLQKDTAKVKWILEKRNIPSLTAEVVTLLDVSGSTRDLYKHGVVQSAVQRIVPVALNFDDNGDIPVYVFDGEFAQIDEPLTKDNYATFVRNEIVDDPDVPKWGNTTYAPVITQSLVDLGFYSEGVVAKTSGFLKKLFGGGSDAQATPASFKSSSKTKLPAIIYIITDGENTDKEDTNYVLEGAAQANSEVYFNFIGVGSENFRYLKQIADRYPNVGFAQIHDLERTANSDDIYQYLIPEELTTWLRKFVK